jgi:hypothetical protein
MIHQCRRTALQLIRTAFTMGVSGMKSQEDKLGSDRVGWGKKKDCDAPFIKELM